MGQWSSKPQICRSPDGLNIRLMFYSLFLVERIGLICQFFPQESIRQSQPSKSVVIHAIAFLCYAVTDAVITVAMKARSMIEAIRLSSLKVNKNIGILNCLSQCLNPVYLGRKDFGEFMILINAGPDRNCFYR